MNLPLPVFLTAFDPAELPGGTVDPLGFTGGYLALADALFPGMTAAAAQATYFPMLAAGLWLAEGAGVLDGLSAARARERRMQVALRFERLWALATALQVGRLPPPETQAEESGLWMTRGLRGISYMQREVERIESKRGQYTTTDFKLLAEQARYGAFGIYGSVAEALGLLDRSTYTLTVGFGAELGRGFFCEHLSAAERREVTAACLDDKTRVRVELLREWGKKVYCGAPLASTPATLLGEAITANPERAQLARLLVALDDRVFNEWSDRSLLQECSRCTENSRVRGLCKAAFAYDDFLRVFTLVFERVVWLCREAGDEKRADEVFADEVLNQTTEFLVERAQRLIAAERELAGLGFLELRGVRGRGLFAVVDRVGEGLDASSAIRCGLRRHAEVQGNKIEHGRPKQVWIEERGDVLALTSSRIGGRAREPRTAEDVRAPDWRFGAMLSLLALGKLPQEAS